MWNTLLLNSGGEEIAELCLRFQLNHFTKRLLNICSGAQPSVESADFTGISDQSDAVN